MYDRSSVNAESRSERAVIFLFIYLLFFLFYFFFSGGTGFIKDKFSRNIKFSLTKTINPIIIILI